MREEVGKNRTPEGQPWKPQEGVDREWPTSSHLHGPLGISDRPPPPPSPRSSRSESASEFCWSLREYGLDSDSMCC